MKIKRMDRNGQFDADPRITRQSDLASLLQRMYGAVDKALTSLEDEKKMGPREINSLVSLAKVLPLLEQAEMARETKISGKSLKDMSSNELRKLAGKVLTRTAEKAMDDDGTEQTLEDDSEDA